MADKPRDTKARNRMDNTPKVNASSRASRRQKPKKVGLVPVLQKRFQTILKLLRSSSRLSFILAAFVVCIILFVTVYIFTNKNAYSIVVNNEVICIIRKDKRVDNDELVEMAVGMIEADLGTRIIINEDVEFRPVNAGKRSIVNPNTAITRIASALTYQVEAISIQVEGVEMAVLRNEAEAAQVRESIIAPFLPEDNNVIADAGFLENYREEIVYVNRDDIDTVEQAYGRLTATSKAAETYVIQSGDTLSVIASKTGMSIDEIFRLNPQYTSKTVLRIGEELTISVDKPLLSVVTYEEIIYTEVVPKSTVTQENPSQPRGYTRAIQYGSDGQAEITAYRVRVNGIEDPLLFEIINSRIIVEPVDEIIEIGVL